MDSFLRRKLLSREKEKGQTMVEYLLLLVASFVAAYLMVTGPLATTTTELLTNIRNGMGNVMMNGEWTTDTIEPGSPGSPSSPSRLRPLHL